MVDIRRSLLSLGFKVSKGEVRNMMSDADLGSSNGYVKHQLGSLGSLCVIEHYVSILIKYKIQSLKLDLFEPIEHKK